VTKAVKAHFKTPYSGFLNTLIDVMVDRNPPHDEMIQALICTDADELNDDKVWTSKCLF
jgi:hypothetical protein